MGSWKNMNQELVELFTEEGDERWSLKYIHNTSKCFRVVNLGHPMEEHDLLVVVKKMFKRKAFGLDNIVVRFFKNVGSGEEGVYLDGVIVISKGIVPIKSHKRVHNFVA